MVTKNQSDTEDTTTTEQFFDIEELKLKRKTPASIYSGVCAAYGWKDGKMVTEEEYDSAVNTFSVSPIGRKVK